MTSFAKAAELAGFFSAHAVWSVSDGATLIPILGHEKDGRRTLARFADEQLNRAVAAGREAIENNAAGADRAVLVCDGFATLPGGKKDALLIRIVEYTPTRRTLDMVLPYRPKNADGGFAVHKPKFVGHVGLDAELASLPEAFFRGVDAHEEGAKVWNASLDQSV